MSILKVNIFAKSVENMEDYSFDNTVHTTYELGTNILAVASGPSIHILNLCNKQVSWTLNLHGTNVYSFVKVKSNLPIVVSCGNEIMVWKLTSGEILAKLQTSHLGGIYSAILMKKTLILASLDHTISLYDLNLKTVM